MLNESSPASDPGWGAALKYSWIDLLVPIPQFAMWRMACKGVDSLTAMRVVFSALN